MLPRLADVTDRVEKHFRLFNEAVRSHDWAVLRGGDHEVIRYAWDIAFGRPR